MSLGVKGAVLARRMSARCLGLDSQHDVLIDLRFHVAGTPLTVGGSGGAQGNWFLHTFDRWGHIRGECILFVWHVHIKMMGHGGGVVVSSGMALETKAEWWPIGF